MMKFGSNLSNLLWVLKKIQQVWYTFNQNYMATAEMLSQQQKMQALVDATNQTVTAASIEDLCDFLDISFNNGQPDAVALTIKSFDILDNKKMTTELDQTKRNRVIKAATEFIGAMFLDCISYIRDSEESIQ